MVALLTSPDGVVFEHAEGKLDVAANVPLRPDAVFRMASMTKPITSAAVMTLVESGKLRLDDPAGRYVAALGDMKVATDVKADGSYTVRAPRRPITVRELMAGIANTHFWVDPTRRLGVILLMQVLPFYDDACIRLLTDLEALVSRFSKE